MPFRKFRFKELVASSAIDAELSKHRPSAVGPLVGEVSSFCVFDCHMISTVVFESLLGDLVASLSQDKSGSSLVILSYFF